MIRTIPQGDLDINNRIACQNASLHSTLNTVVDSRDVFLRDSAANDSVDELVTLAGLVGLDLDLNMTVLALTTRLTCVLGLLIGLLADGSYHEVDSSEMAFSIAGSIAFKDAMRKADPIITEPIMKVAVIVPDEYLGDVIGDLNSRRGQIQGMEAMAGTQRVNAFVPLAQMFGYATDLRSKTQGRGQYSMEPVEYQQVPMSVADKIMAERAHKV